MSQQKSASSSSASQFHHKPSQKVPKQIGHPERLKRLFTSLCAQIDGGHFSNATKTCDRILRLAPGDEDAMRTKLFLLLQTEQYEQALTLIASCPEERDFAPEKAYVLYRLHRESDAVGVLTQIEESKKDERGVLHLQAQLNYRQGSYQAACDLYSDLLDTAEPQSEEHSDISTNLTASQQHLDFITTGFLRALDALPASIINNLESSVPPVPQVSSISSTLFASHSGAAKHLEDAHKDVKKVRMSRVPKGVIPGVTPPPDPERWLKKSERSTFGQGAKRRKGGSGATQGVVADISSVAHAANHATKSTGAGQSKGKKKK